MPAALLSAIAILAVAGCGTSNTGASTSSTSPASSMVPPSPAAAASLSCDRLGGTKDHDACHVRAETPVYTLDFRFPVTYPEMAPVTDYIAGCRDDFVDWMTKNPVPGGIHSELEIIGNSYSSAGTNSLVPTIETEGGVHPVTTYKAFNYDVDKHAPITFDTLFEPGAHPQNSLNPIVQRELEKRKADDVSSADVGVDAYQNFALSDDSVIFFINQDGAFPHYVGSRSAGRESELAPLLAGSDAPPPCASGQVSVTAEQQAQAGSTLRAVTLAFGLAPGAGACTVTGYPGVDSGAGGPLVHADRSPRGYMGGLPEGVDEPPTRH
jgi:hypothetical protein